MSSVRAIVLLQEQEARSKLRANLPFGKDRRGCVTFAMFLIFTPEVPRTSPAVSTCPIRPPLSPVLTCLRRRRPQGWEQSSGDVRKV